MEENEIIQGLLNKEETYLSEFIYEYGELMLNYFALRYRNYASMEKHKFL